MLVTLAITAAPSVTTVKPRVKRPVDSSYLCIRATLMLALILLALRDSGSSTRIKVLFLSSNRIFSNGLLLIISM